LFIWKNHPDTIHKRKLRDCSSYTTESKVKGSSITKGNMDIIQKRKFTGVFISTSNLDITRTKVKKLFIMMGNENTIQKQRLNLGRVWRYQRGNQNPYIVEVKTTQSTKEKVQKDKQRSTKLTYKTKDRVTRTQLKTGGELMCSGRTIKIQCTKKNVKELFMTKDIQRYYTETMVNGVLISKDISNAVHYNMLQCCNKKQIEGTK
jgi:hypothetical protein